jgi:hypothetical protein
VLSTVFSFYSAVAVWAGLSRRHWFVRAAVVVAALLLLLPPRTYEPAVLFMAHAGIVIASLTVIRFVQARRSGVEEGRRPGIRLRFRLADMLLAIIIVGAMTAMGAHVYRQPLLFGTLNILLFATFSTAASTLAAAWLVLGRSWLLARLIVFALVVAAGGIYWYWYGLFFLNVFLSSFGDEGMAAFLSCVCSLVFLAWLLLLRVAGFLSKWRYLSAAEPTSRWIRRLSQATIVLLVPAISTAMLFIYREVARPLPPKETVAANPNGHNDLLQAADRLNDVLVPLADETPPASAAAFVARHQAALKQIRTGLSRECQVPLSYNIDDMSGFIESFQLARALDIEAEVAANEGRMADAARIGVDCMRLGNAVSEGGLQIDCFYGDYIESFGFRRVAEVSHGLTADECREVVDAIDVIDSAREALSAVRQRNHAWSQHVWGWRYTLARAVGARAGVAGEIDYTWIGVRNVASMRLLQTELAIRAFRLEHNRYPDGLDELVPSLLRKIPVDPYCDKPLVYRREGNEYLLYGAGGNGVDDGGQRVPWEQYIEGKGDLFLDTLTESR